MARDLWQLHQFYRLKVLLIIDHDLLLLHFLTLLFVWKMLLSNRGFDYLIKEVKRLIDIKLLEPNKSNGLKIEINDIQLTLLQSKK